MKKLAILSGAIVAGLLAFSPASAGAGVSTGATVLLYANSGAPMVTKAHYKKRKLRRKLRRRHRRYDSYYGYYGPYYRPHVRRDYRHWDSYYGWHDHRGHWRRGRGGFGLFFGF